MVSQGIQSIGVLTGLFGWLLVIVTCGLPQWRVTAFIGANIVTAQVIWEGIWMTCVVQSTGQMQCKVYDSVLALSRDLQAARAMTVISIMAGIIGLLMSLAGGKCTNFIKSSQAKSIACIVAGVSYISAGMLCLIPVCWSAHTTIAAFYNIMVLDAQRRELGTSLYIGWTAAGLLLLGGVLLCLNCPPRDQPVYASKYSASRSNPTSKEYV